MMRGAHRQRGAAAAEYAIVLTAFMVLVIAVMEFSRLMFIYSTAVEATRLGARVAVVCDTADIGKVRARMKSMLSILDPASINITYPATECTALNCDPVTVKLSGVKVTLSIPLVPIQITLPSFSTSLAAESLDSTSNAMCN